MNLKKVFFSITTWSVRLVGVLLLVFAGWALVQGLTGTKETIREGLFGINFEWSPEKSAVILTSVTKKSAADKAGLQSGDIIQEFNGSPLGTENYNYAFGDSIEGMVGIFKVKRGEAVYTITVKKKLTGFSRRLMHLFALLVLPLLLMVYCIIGFWATFKKAGWTSIRIALICMSLGTLLYCSALNLWGFRLSVFPASFLNILAHLLAFTYCYFPLFWLWFFLYYPDKANYEWMRSRLIMSISFLAGTFFYIHHFIYDTNAIPMPVLKKILHFTFLLTAVTLGLMIMSRGTKKAPTLRRKRQYRLLEFGLNFGMLSPLLGAVGLHFLDIFQTGEENALHTIVPIVYYLGQLGGLLLPYTFFIFLRKSRLIETTSTLKRKVLHVMASTILFIAYLISILTVGNILVSIMGVRESKIIILFTLLVAITFYPLNRRILKLIERWIYPERTRYRHSLQLLGREMQGIIDWRGIVFRLNRWFDETMGISPVILTAPGITDELLPKAFTPELGVTRRLENGGMFFWDELSDDDLVDPVQREWIDNRNISVTVPMMAAGEIVGLMHFGKKKKNADFTGDDVVIFRDAALKTAPMLQVLKLQAEQLEKKRLVKELDMARAIQEQLMAPSIPEIEGFRLYGTSRACLEMGGDYYDMISLDRTRVLLAVADVCGKGAGAALLMTNIQAALRIVTRMYDSLDEIMKQLNAITCDNTNSRQFITLFTGILNSSDRSLEYVNAGHSPAILVPENGNEQQLTRTGIALGLRRNSAYSSRKVTFNPGDLLTIYTDGFDESFNPEDEMFGVPNIIKLLKKNREKPPETIADTLLNAVKTFARGVAPKDDLTLVIAQVESTEDSNR